MVIGVPGRFSEPDGNGVQGLNERKSVEGLYQPFGGARQIRVQQ